MFLAFNIYKNKHSFTPSKKKIDIMELWSLLALNRLSLSSEVR